VRPTYVTPTSESIERLIAQIFAVGAIGYVALDRNGEVIMRAKVTAGTSVETNFYEEYFVNPTVVRLTSRRGAIDCGGLSHVAIAYGDFTQVLVPTKFGHISLGVAKSADVAAVVAGVRGVMEGYEDL
jgi:hypothetical protein